MLNKSFVSLKKFNVSPENMLNFVEVNKFHGPGVKMTTNERPDASISPDSHIFTISLGDSCSITFKDCCSNDAHSLNVSDNAMCSMSLNTRRPRGTHFVSGAPLFC